MKVVDTESFIEKAKSIHGDTYNYELVNYVNAKTKVKIICKNYNHGVFYQSPNSHLNKRGCPKCGVLKNSKSQTKNNNYFINKAKSIHGDKYNYDKVVYVRSNKKVIIHCPKHGDFEQTPNGHLHGSGCKLCGIIVRANSRKIKIEDLLIRFKEVHGDKYDYSFVKYKSIEDKINIKCKKHDFFYQSSHGHLCGKGYPKCGREKVNNHHKTKPTGWGLVNWIKASETSKVFDSFKVYIIKCYNETETFYKIGRTFRKTIDRFKSGLPYNYEILKEIVFDDAKECFNKETELKRINKEFKYKPKLNFHGRHECFYKINL